MLVQLCFLLQFVLQNVFFLPFSDEIVTKSFKHFLFLHFMTSSKHSVNRHMYTTGKKGNVSNFKCSSAMFWSFSALFCLQGKISSVPAALGLSA